MNDMILKDGRMPTSTPEEQGIPSHAILWFLDQVEREHLDLHSLQIVRNGVLVADMVAAPFIRQPLGGDMRENHLIQLIEAVLYRE